MMNFSRATIRCLCIALVPIQFAGCIGPFDPCGSDVGSFAVQVNVTDARNGGPPSTQPTLVVKDGAFADTAVGPSPGTVTRVFVAAAVERPGTYDVTVTAPGYLTWTKSGVQVGRGKCDKVETARLTAELQPQP